MRVPDLASLQSYFATLSRREQEKFIGELIGRGCSETHLALATGLSVELIRRIMARRAVGL